MREGRGADGSLQSSSVEPERVVGGEEVQSDMGRQLFDRRQKERPIVGVSMAI